MPVGKVYQGYVGITYGRLTFSRTIRTEKNVKVRAVGREKRERELLIQDTYFRMKRSELSAFGGLTMPIY
eukprot:scaffold6262_cov51-Skeletonema_menzelii.AAC.1